MNFTKQSAANQKAAEKARIKWLLEEAKRKKKEAEKAAKGK